MIERFKSILIWILELQINLLAPGPGETDTIRVSPFALVAMLVAFDCLILAMLIMGLYGNTGQKMFVAITSICSLLVIFFVLAVLT